jgi:hypothetical protein
MTDEIPYITEDYKKYAFATGKEYIKRIQEIVDTLDKRFGFDTDTSQDLMYLLENAVDVYLYRAAFFDNHLQGQSRNIRSCRRSTGPWMSTAMAGPSAPQNAMARVRTSTSPTSGIPTRHIMAAAGVGLREKGDAATCFGGCRAVSPRAARCTAR